MNKIVSTKNQSIVAVLLAFVLSFSLLTGCTTTSEAEVTNDVAKEQIQSEATQDKPNGTASEVSSVSLGDISAYSGSPYIEINGNVPQFSEADKARTSFEEYSALDSLGRCGVAFALVGLETMPTEERGSIGEVKPSGWHTVRYNGVVDGNYLYNRCHLIGYQLTGENANVKNLITGTRYLNIDGMLPFENDVADYVENTGHHVLYRVTPIFEGENLVASGVQMEAYSVEDNGAGISFNVYCYNVQPGIEIDYATGESCLAEQSESTATALSVEQHYVLNTNSKKFHNPSCSSVNSMSAKNKQDYTGTREDLINQGYTPCGRCNP